MAPVAAERYEVALGLFRANPGYPRKQTPNYSRGFIWPILQNCRTAPAGGSLDAAIDYVELQNGTHDEDYD
jgi:hypothetical protein